MTRGDLVASAKRIVRVVDAVTRPNSPGRRRSTYLMLKDYIALAEGPASKVSTEAKE